MKKVKGKNILSHPVRNHIIKGQAVVFIEKQGKYAWYFDGNGFYIMRDIVSEFTK